MINILRKNALRTLVCAPLVLASAVTHAAPESAQQTATDALQRLRSNAGTLTESVNTALAYSLLRAGGSLPLLQDNTAAAPLDRALNFLSLNGIAVGVTDPLNELVLKRIADDSQGRKSVHLDQVHAGLPVFGARLVVHMNNAGITGVNGVFVPNLASLPTTPAVGVDQLRATALQLVAKRHRNVQMTESRKLAASDLSIESTRLMVYRSGLLEGRSGHNYLAYEAFVRGPVALNGLPVRERVILDAANGGLINMIDEVHTLLNREIHTPTFATAPLITEGSALAPNDLPLQNDDRTATSSRVPPIATTGLLLPLSNLYVFAGGTYDLYKNLFGREGYDDGARPPEEQVQHSVYLVNQQCPNAYWDGASTNYCPAFDADDVVSHEWSHAYTEYTHGLIYQFQSGALNESYSDIFGEMYDLTNGIEGPLGITLTEGEYFENGGSRWVVGEDLTETAASLLLRDMWDPDNFTVNVPLLGLPITSFAPSPGSVITSPNYFCGTGDGGGVHTNSGVPNHAFAMLVDGKEFNGVTIPKIGMIKAAHIYFRAMTQYQTPTTNFAQHADAIEASCKDLIGADLNDMTGAVSGEQITPADCDAVAAATLATEMRMSAIEKCGYQPMLRPLSETPAICSSDSEVVDFSENWDGADKADFPAGWTVTNNFTGDNPVHYPWTISSELPPGREDAGNAAYALNESTGGGAAGSGQDQSRSTLLESPEIVLTSDASFFKFTHIMQTEFDFDGGNLKVSLNGGAFAVVPASAFSFNPYNDGEMLPAPDNTSPLAGEPGWTGTDGGESFSTWATSIVDLAALGAKTGDKVKFRFDYGQDVASGNLGWFVDDLAVVHCGASKVAAKSVGTGRFGGALGLGLLLPLALFGMRRKRSA